MKSDQTEIYYISGSHIDLITKNPNLEYFIKNDIEVLYLTDPVDLFKIPYIREYDGKQLKSIDKADLNISNKENIEENQESIGFVISKFKEVLKDKVEDVTISSRLIDSPATLVVGNQGLDPQLEKMMQMMDKEFTASKRILEINPSHKLIINIGKLIEKGNNEELIENSIVQLFEASMLIEGYMKNPVDFVKRMTDFMTKATQ